MLKIIKRDNAYHRFLVITCIMFYFHNYFMIPKLYLNMKGTKKILALMLPAIFAMAGLSGQSQYTDARTMAQKINKLAADYPTLCTARAIVKTAGGKEIWVISIGTGDKDKKPAVAIIGGIEGSYLLGSELALGFADSLLGRSKENDVRNLLDKITFYIIPDASPDSREQFFTSLKYERNINASKTDDDRDFAADEDPFEDMNNDGLITQIRVSDPAGNMTESEDDKRVMVPADLSKGQLGSYLVFTEGTDNDKDNQFNEDCPGGVNFNRNFTFNYEEFGLNAGLHPVSEPETKAIADFLYDHFNIYATFAFGPQDNLGTPAKGQERPAGGAQSGQGVSQMGGARSTGDRRITSIMKSDETINKLVSDKYHEITGLKGAPPVKASPGNFMDWAYYHYGRYSFSTPGWWFPADKAKNSEAAFLKYSEENKLPDPFVPWTEIKHPDFPGKKVEVGGIKPFVMINPPADKIGELVSKNYRFIVAVAALHPELEFLDTKIENAGENIFRITIKVHNKGVFATCAEIGDINQWTKIMRIVAEPSKDQSFLSGQKVQRIQRLEGDKSVEYSWLISGKGSVKITAGAINTGTITTTLDLK
jgi:hypothetical protein